MAQGTDVNELPDAPGTGTLASNTLVPVKIPGTQRGELHKAPVSRLPGNGNGGPGVLSEVLTLAAAQARPNATPPNPQVVAGLRYIITGTWNANTTPLTATVHVDGLDANTYASTGWAYDANDVLQPVRVDVAAGLVDTRPLRDLQLIVVKVDENTGDFVAWVGGDIDGTETIEEHLIS